MLWPRGRVIREQNLHLYNKFSSLIKPDRLIIEHVIPKELNTISIDNDDNYDWKSKAWEHLEKDGIVIISCKIDQKYKIADALNYFAVNPIKLSYLSVFAKISSVVQNTENINIEIEVMESLQ